MVKQGDFIMFHEWFLNKHKISYTFKEEDKYKNYSNFGRGPFEILSIKKRAGFYSKYLTEIRFKVKDFTSIIILGENKKEDKSSYFDWGCPFEVVKMKKYTDVCPRCGAPAYIGFTNIECSNERCI